MSQHFKFARIKPLLGYRSLSGIGILAAVAAIAGCNSDSNISAPTGPQGLIQFINAAPRYSSIDLNVDSTDVAPGESYGNGQSVYVKAQTTPRRFFVRISNDTTTLASSQVLVSDQSTYAVIVTQHPVGANMLVVPDTVTSPTGNLASLRVINASPSAGTVDVYITGTDTTLANPVAASLPLDGISGYVNEPIGVARVRITAAGTKNVLLDVDGSSLTAGQVRTVLLLDSAGGGLPVTWLSIPDRG